MTENKPVAWTYTTRAFGNILSLRKPLPSVDTWNVEPLYRHPPAPQPVTDPAVEAARRKALRAIFDALTRYPDVCDTVIGPAITYGVLRDLVGRPRLHEDRAIGGYEYGGANDAPGAEGELDGVETGRPRAVDLAPPPARLSVDQITAVIRNSELRGNLSVLDIARAVHEAIYGKDEPPAQAPWYR